MNERMSVDSMESCLILSHCDQSHGIIIQCLRPVPGSGRGCAADDGQLPSGAGGAPSSAQRPRHRRRLPPGRGDPARQTVTQHRRRQSALIL